MQRTIFVWEYVVQREGKQELYLNNIIYLKFNKASQRTIDANHAMSVGGRYQEEGTDGI